MRSLASIIDESRKQGIRAANEEKRPLVIEQEDIENSEVLRDTIQKIPNIGSYVPDGWTETERFFVDATGYSDPKELAFNGCLSFEDFLQKIKPGKGYAIVEEGQFQVRVGEFEKGEK